MVTPPEIPKANQKVLKIPVSFLLVVVQEVELKLSFRF